MVRELLLTANDKLNPTLGYTLRVLGGPSRQVDFDLAMGIMDAVEEIYRDNTEED